jgi:hypothetical protein
MKMYLASAILNLITALFSLAWIFFILTINDWSWFNWINVVVVVICGIFGLFEFVLYKNESNKNNLKKVSEK